MDSLLSDTDQLLFPMGPCEIGVNSQIFLVRIDGQLNFNRTWGAYKSLVMVDKSTDSWLGLDELNRVTDSPATVVRQNVLCVVVEDWSNRVFSSQYSHFSVGPESEGYRLDLSGYNPNSTARDCLLNPRKPPHIASSTACSVNGVQFSTIDRPSDPSQASKSAQVISNTS